MELCTQASSTHCTELRPSLPVTREWNTMNSTNPNIKVGSLVLFGRNHGEKTLGRVLKINRERYKVRQLSGRGTLRNYKPGQEWAVPVSLIELAPEDTVIPEGAETMTHPEGTRVMEIEGATPVPQESKADIAPAPKPARRQVLAPMAPPKRKATRKAKPTAKAKSQARTNTRPAAKPAPKARKAASAKPREKKDPMHRGLVQRKGESLQEFHRRVLGAMRALKAASAPMNANHDLH